MPILNKNCVEYAVLAALAMNANLSRVSYFDRKHYFYPDSPSGYQITQKNSPIGLNGRLTYMWYDSKKEENIKSHCNISCIQIENDTGKTVQDDVNKEAFIDLNRTGVPLIEIVTEPNFNSADQVIGFLEELQCLLRQYEVSSCIMAHGQMRVDVNINMIDEEKLGFAHERVELKNLNSILDVGKVIDCEIDRQRREVESGKAIVKQTRYFDSLKNETYFLREKDSLLDYRYIQEPNLPPIRTLEKCGKCNSDTSLPNHNSYICLGCMVKKYPILNLKEEQRTNKLRPILVEKMFLSLKNAQPILWYPDIAILFMKTYQSIIDKKEKISSKVFFRRGSFEETASKEIYFWITSSALSVYKKKNAKSFNFDSEKFSEFIILCLTGKIHGRNAFELFNDISANKIPSGSLEEYAISKNILLITDADFIRKVCHDVVKENQNFVKKYHSKKNGSKLLKKIQTLVHEKVDNLSPGHVKIISEEVLTNTK